MDIRFLAFVLLFVAAVASGAETPRLDIRIGPAAAGQGHVQSQAVTTDTLVSNTRFIPLTVAANANERLPRFVTGSGGHDTLEIEAWQITAEGCERVPVKFIVQSSGVDFGLPFARLLLQLPISDEERQNIINDYIDHPTDGTPEQQRMLRERRDQVVAAMSAIFVQNRVGRFELRVRFHNTDSAYWTGAVEGTVTIDVANDGTFFDMMRANNAMRAVRARAPQ